MNLTKAIAIARALGGSSGSGGGGSGGGWPEVPNDGATYLYISLAEGRTSPMLGVGVNGTVTVDWGDGTKPDVLTGTNVAAAYTQWTTNHDYAAPGNYVIRLTVDGEMQFTGSSSDGTYIIRHAKTKDTRNRAYNHALKRVVIGENVVGIYSYAFQDCCSLSSVTIPDSVSIGSYSFMNCFDLAAVKIPDIQTRIFTSAFEGCHSLKTIVIPSSVTQIDASAFSSCYFLESMTMQGNVLTIAGSAFTKCYVMRCYDFTACTAVPALSATSAFNNIPADCEIRVPAALYDEWIAATNWATYAANIKAY